MRKGVRREVSKGMMRQAVSGVRNASARVSTEYQSICYYNQCVLVKVNYYIVKEKGLRDEWTEKGEAGRRKTRKCQ